MQFSFALRLAEPRNLARAPAHPMVTEAVKTRLREQYRTLDPVALLAEVRAVARQAGISTSTLPE
jgi:hypothetical protein